MTTDTMTRNAAAAAETVTVTERAAKKIARILAREPDKSAFRVTVSGGGCSGFQYGFDLESNRADDDVAIERDGVTVLIDPISLMYMNGSEIDFVDELIGASFQVKNPHATAACGCGTSFSL